MHTILGAGGVIARELSQELLAHQLPLRLVSRRPHQVPGAEWKAADLTQAGQVREAVRGASIVYLMPGLRYHLPTWESAWPLIMRNTLAACRDEGARLVFFDNVYCLGNVDGPMTEATPWNPTSRKGEVRARIARMLLDEVQAGNLKALIARAADFYGPNCSTSVFNTLVTDRLARGRRAQWMLQAGVPHSLTYTPDCGRALRVLASSEAAWNQVWHLPTASPAWSAQELVEEACRLMGGSSRISLISRGMLRLIGLFNGVIREFYEMAYQYDSPYLFDSSRIEQQLGLRPTSYAEGLRILAASYRKPA
ncbi:MAG TPA: NAD-dependent epimerase/dehydratase family protein [Chitinophagaceae bacterium]|nr:NAD-dependent epimerase/dehydratase family protein [Chitinophagaceae bacterium]